MYDSIDTKKTGSIGKSDIETAIKNGNLKPPTTGPQSSPDATGKPHGSGGPGRARRSGGASNSSTTYAAAETNQDGVVSVQKAAIYAMKHPSISTSDGTKADPSKLGKNVDKLA
jgi:hypothetical protein